MEQSISVIWLHRVFFFFCIWWIIQGACVHFQAQSLYAKKILWCGFGSCSVMSKRYDLNDWYWMAGEWKRRVSWFIHQNNLKLPIRLWSFHFGLLMFFRQNCSSLLAMYREFNIIDQKKKDIKYVTTKRWNSLNNSINGDCTIQEYSNVITKHHKLNEKIFELCVVFVSICACVRIRSILCE